MSTQNGASRGSMLLSFSGENIRSFQGTFEISLVATSMSMVPVVRRLPWRDDGSLASVLPVAGVFGANGSGKSNLLKAMDDMRSFVLFSFRLGQPNGGMPRRPFLLDPKSEKAPSRFTVDLILEGVRHEYGFIIDSQKVIDEWAHHYPLGRKRLLFERHMDEVKFGDGDASRGRAVTKLLRPNALYLSTAASANHKGLLPLFGWFERNLQLAVEASRTMRQALTSHLLEDPLYGEMVLGLLRAADLGITGVTKQDLDPLMKGRMLRAVRILSGQEGDSENSIDSPAIVEQGVRLTHKGSASEVDLDVADESLGTLIWFGLVGPVVEALVKGAVFLADELDASLHPVLVSEIVRMFQDPDSNPNRAQLIFNSHDASLLGSSSEDKLLGRDQIWFTEKDGEGGSHIFPLSDLDPRKNEALGKRYLAGRYGATPIISSQEFAAVSSLIPIGRDNG
jgi:uncharacterized protein